MTTWNRAPSAAGAIVVALGLGILCLGAGGCDRLSDAVAGAIHDDEGIVEPGTKSDDAPGEGDADASGDAAAAPVATETKTTGGVTRMMAKVAAAKPKFPVYGVVKDGTKMYTGANTASPYLVAGGDDSPIPPHMRYYGYGHRGAAPTEEEGKLGRAVRILAMDGEMFEVENITVEDEVLTCAPIQPELAHTRVRLWVPKDSLVPLLDRATTVQVDEHSKVTLAAGVPAFATEEEDKFRVRADGISFELRLPEVPTALWHSPGAAMDPSGAVGSLGSWYAMTFDGKTFPPMGSVGRQMGQLYGDVGGTSWVYADEIKGGQARVRVKNRCVDVEGVVVTDARSTAPTAKLPATSRRRILDKAPTVLAGTTLRWEDGTTAGVVVAPAIFAGTKRTQGTDVCFGITTEAGGPELCFSAEDAKAAPAGASELDGLQLTANGGWGAQSKAQAMLNDELWEQYEPMRACFRKHIKNKVGHNYASANINMQMKTDGDLAIHWTSAWTSRGESRKLQTCIDTVIGAWTIDDPPADAVGVVLYLSATQT